MTTAEADGLTRGQVLGLAGAIVYMAQIAGGSIGLGLNTALVLGGATLADGIAVAFKLNAALALAGFVVTILFIGTRVDRARLAGLVHHLRAHA